MAQMAFEELLRDRARVTTSVAGRLPSGIQVDAATFAQLLRVAQTHGWITQQEFGELNRLRLELRNPYVHTKDVHASGRAQRGDFFLQDLKFEAHGSTVGLEAREAASILVRLMPTIIRRLWSLT
jgi:hypothetical protein